MTSLRQIEANRRNARLSTGPVTDEGKSRSRKNALRHGLTAETVISAVEDAEDYTAFQMAVTSDYDPQTCVERELVLRLASLLWRVRRATAIETGLFNIQALHLSEFRQRQQRHEDNPQFRNTFSRESVESHDNLDAQQHSQPASCEEDASLQPADERNDLTTSFLRLTNLPSCPLDRLSRYETTLWRQARQTLLILQTLSRRRPWAQMRLRSNNAVGQKNGSSF